MFWATLCSPMGLGINTVAINSMTQHSRHCCGGFVPKRGHEPSTNPSNVNAGIIKVHQSPLALTSRMKDAALERIRSWFARLETMYAFQLEVSE